MYGDGARKGVPNLHIWKCFFFIAPLSLLWPDGIREHPEAVKANTSKKKKGGVQGGAIGATRELTGLRGKGARRKCGESKTQERKKKLISCSCNKGLSVFSFLLQIKIQTHINVRFLF